MWLLDFLMKKQAATTLNPKNTQPAKSSCIAPETGSLVMYHEVVKLLLETYFTDDVIAEVDPGV